MSSYERYIADQEDYHYNLCYEHRKLLGLPVDFDLTSLECDEQKCRKGCPLSSN